MISKEPASNSKRTLAETVRDRIRDDIFSGRIRPGQRLMFAELCERHNASVGVVREALAALDNQGLVTAAAHKGYTVTPLSTSDLEDVVGARTLIEPLVLRLAVEQGDVQWEAALMGAFHVMYRTARAAEPTPYDSEWEEAHRVFHSTLFSACQNEKLLEITRILADDAALYRRWSYMLDADDHDVIGDHRKIMEAALAREADLAASLLREHIIQTADRLQSHLPEASPEES